MLSSDLYHMIPLIHNSSVWFVLNHYSLSPYGLVVKTLVAKSRGCGFESPWSKKIIFQILLIFKNCNEILSLNKENKIKIKIINKSLVLITLQYTFAHSILPLHGRWVDGSTSPEPFSSFLQVKLSRAAFSISEFSFAKTHQTSARSFFQPSYSGIARMLDDYLESSRISLRESPRQIPVDKPPEQHSVPRMLQTSASCLVCFLRLASSRSSCRLNA